MLSFTDPVSQTLLLTRKYVLWRFALVCERLWCGPGAALEALGMGGDYPRA